MDNCVIVDTNYKNFINQLDNSIPLIPYSNNFKDLELIKLCNYLEYLACEAKITKKSVTFLNSKYFGFSNLENYESLNEAYEALFYLK